MYDEAIKYANIALQQKHYGSCSVLALCFISISDIPSAFKMLKIGVMNNCLECFNLLSLLFSNDDLYYLLLTLPNSSDLIRSKIAELSLSVVDKKHVTNILIHCTDENILLDENCDILIQSNNNSQDMYVTQEEFDNAIDVISDVIQGLK